MDLRERVLAGAAFLDRVKPDWFRLVDLERFDMRWGEFCLLGCMFQGDPDYGLAVFDMDPGEAAWHGFDVEPSARLEAVQVRLDELTGLWVGEIVVRRKADGAAGSQRSE